MRCELENFTLFIGPQTTASMRTRMSVSGLGWIRIRFTKPGLTTTLPSSQTSDFPIVLGGRLNGQAFLRRNKLSSRPSTQATFHPINALVDMAKSPMPRFVVGSELIRSPCDE